MSYAIYRVNTDEFLKEWDKAHGREPEWVAADSREPCKVYDTRSEAQQDCNILEDVLKINYVMVLNLENKQL